MAEIEKLVGEKVKIYRENAGLTQSKLGELAGLHGTYIGMIERGEKKVSIVALDKIIRALGLSYDTFFFKIRTDSIKKPDAIALECYDHVLRMTEKEQKLMLGIIKNISEMTKL